MPEKCFEVAEADVGAREPEIPQKMVVKLHEAASGVACFDHLPPMTAHDVRKSAATDTFIGCVSATRTQRCQGHQFKHV